MSAARSSPIWRRLNLQFVTPAFVGQPSSPGSQIFPVSSLRGVLRYWLRALAGAYLGNDLAALAQCETMVFGTASGGDGQPSAILLRSAQPVIFAAAAESHTWLPTSGPGRQHIGYLLGQCLYDSATKSLQRPFLMPRSDLPLRVKNLGGADEWTLFLAALWALQTFGGIGARARRGFGTIVLLRCDVLDDAPPWMRSAEVRDVLRAVGEALDSLGFTASADIDIRPRYPSFDLAESPTWYRTADHPYTGTEVSAALAETGWTLRSFRLASTEERASSQDRPSADDGRGRNTTDYREIVKPYLNDTRGSRPVPLNAALGLPTTYSDPVPGGPNSSGRRSAVIEPLLPTQTRSSPPPPANRPDRPSPLHMSRPSPLRKGAGAGPRSAPAPAAVRRASPLWLRVHRTGESWKIRSLAFYAEWLPAGSKLQIRDTTSTAVRSYQHRSAADVATPTEEQIDDTLDGWFDWIHP